MSFAVLSQEDVFQIFKSPEKNHFTIDFIIRRAFQNYLFSVIIKRKKKETKKDRKFITPFPVPPKREALFLLLPPWGKVGKGV